jgi:hypothetical protein
VRLLALTPVVFAFVLGGVALAEPARTTDASSAPAGDDSWFAQEAKLPAPLPDVAIRDPWAPREMTNPSSAAVARAPAENDVERARPTHGALRASTQPSLANDVSIVDPWAPPVIASETPSLRDGAPRTMNRSRGARFSERFVEVRDPWQRMPEPAAMGRVRLTFDPWAR